MAGSFHFMTCPPHKGSKIWRVLVQDPRVVGGFCSKGFKYNRANRSWEVLLVGKAIFADGQFPPRPPRRLPVRTPPILQLARVNHEAPKTTARRCVVLAGCE